MNPHRSRLSQHPLAQLAICLSAGICAASYLPNKVALSVVAGAVCLTLSVIFVLNKRTGLAGALLLMALFFAGSTLAVLETRSEAASDVKRLVEEYPGKPLTLTGVLDGPPEFARDKVYLSLRVERIAADAASGRVWLLVPLRGDEYSSLQLRYGARIQLTTTLDRIGNYRNPGVSTLSEFLDRRDYDATGIVKNRAAIVRLEDARGFALLALLYRWREQLQHIIDARFAPETAGVLDASTR